MKLLLLFLLLAAPGQPASLSVEADEAQLSVTLTWSSVADAQGYRIHRDGLEVATVPGDVTQIALNGYAFCTEYTFGVSAFNAAGDGPVRTRVWRSPCAASGGDAGDRVLGDVQASLLPAAIALAVALAGWLALRRQRAAKAVLVVGLVVAAVIVAIGAGGWP